jgi:hypothetical protein
MAPVTLYGFWLPIWLYGWWFVLLVPLLSVIGMVLDATDFPSWLGDSFSPFSKSAAFTLTATLHAMLSLLASFLNSTLLGKTPTSTRTLRPACHDDRRTATSTMSRHAPPHATHCLRCSRECAPI